MEPATRAEAEAYRYGRWAGNPQGYAFNPRYCAQPIIGSTRGGLPNQCGGRAGHGAEGLWCRAHDPARKAAKLLAHDAALQAEREADAAIEQEAVRLLAELGVQGGVNWSRHSFHPVRALVIPFDQALMLVERLRGKE